jgi:hypothetical protein
MKIISTKVNMKLREEKYYKNNLKTGYKKNYLNKHMVQNLYPVKYLIWNL